METFGGDGKWYNPDGTEVGAAEPAIETPEGQGTEVVDPSGPEEPVQP